MFLEVSCRLSQLPIGSIISPNPPFYPNNYDSQEYHRLPEGSVFVLDFFHFDVEDLDIHGNRTDYVRVCASDAHLMMITLFSNACRSSN